MRIGFICDTYRPGGFGGGISRYCEILGQALVSLGHEVHVFSLDLNGEHDYGCIPQKTIVHTVPRYRPTLVGWRTVYWRVLGSVFPGYLFNLSWGVPVGRHLIKLAQRHQLDLIEVPETGGHLAWHTRRLNRYIPVCVRLHAPSCITAMSSRAGQPRHLRQLGRMEAMQVREAFAVSAPSIAVLKLIRREFRLPLKKAEVIPYPAVVPRLRHDGFEAARSKRIVFVGRLEPLKGIDVLIRAFSKVQQLYPDVQLHLVAPDTLGLMNDGPLGLARKYLPAERAERVAKGITWHGSKTPAEADRIRATAACVVVPSKFENFPYAVIEAMALGCPVVASRVGGIPELIEHEENGLLFQPGSDEALASALGRVLCHPEWSIALGLEARCTVSQRIEARRMGARLADWYSGVIERHSKKRAGPLRLLLSKKLRQFCGDSKCA